MIVSRNTHTNIIFKFMSFVKSKLKENSRWRYHELIEGPNLSKLSRKLCVLSIMKVPYHDCVTCGIFIRPFSLRKSIHKWGLLKKAQIATIIYLQRNLNYNKVKKTLPIHDPTVVSIVFKFTLPSINGCVWNEIPNLKSQIWSISVPLSFRC